VLVLLLTAFRGGWGELRAAVGSRRTMTILAASTAALSINWFVFITAVATGHVVEASLGYFINPLINVLLGMIFLRERLRRWQGVGLVLAALGVIYLAWSRGQFPWIAVVLAITFGCYGLFRKVAPVGSMPGLTVETAILFIPAVFIIVAHRTTASAEFSTGTWLLLMLAGVVTAVPLLLFAAAAKRLRLMTMGFLQYISPTCQFLLAVFAFGEAFGRSELISFGLIWTALAVYSFDAYVAYRQGQPIAAQPIEEP
jgi:chloramphenicol-sensitive protein RarD